MVYYLLIVAAWYVFYAFVGLCSLIAGAYFIWLVVRRVNRRDDPRHLKLVPDVPGLTPIQCDSLKFRLATMRQALRSRMKTRRATTRTSDLCAGWGTRHTLNGST